MYIAPPPINAQPHPFHAPSPLPQVSDLADEFAGASVEGASGGGKPKKKASKKVSGASAVTRARDEGYNLAIQNMERCSPHYRVPPPLIREHYEVMRDRVAFLEGWIAKLHPEVPTHLMAEVESAQCRLVDSLAGVEVYEHHVTTHAEKGPEPTNAQWQTEYDDLMSQRALQLLEEEETGAAEDL